MLKLLLANVLVSVFLFSGVLFGWAPLQKILLSEHDGKGQFFNLCDSSTNVTKFPCQQQLQRLNLIYTLGTFTLSLSSLPGGWFLDTYGVRSTIFVSGVLEITGLVLFGIADSETLDTFIPGAILMSIGGFLIMVSAFPVSFIFPKSQTIILAAVSCLFDASSLTFQVFAELTKFISRKNLFVGYAAIACLVYSGLFVLWGWAPSQHDSNNEHELDPNTSLVQNEAQLVGYDDDDNDNNDDEAEGHMEPPIMWSLPISKQLKSFEFLFIVIFASVQQLRANTYIGLNDQILTRMGDTNGHYIDIFGYALPAGLFFIPLIDIVVNMLGLVGAIHATNILGIMYGGLVLVQCLPVQIVTFVAFTGYRAFLYSVMSTFNANVFGLQTLGRITGFVFTSSAVFQLLQYPIVNSIPTYFHNDPFYPQVCLVSLSGFVIPFVIFFQCARNPSRTAAATGAKDLHSPLLDIASNSPDESQASSARKLRRGSSFLRSPSSHPGSPWNSAPGSPNSHRRTKT